MGVYLLKQNLQVTPDRFSYVIITHGVVSGWITVRLDITGTTSSPGLPVATVSDPVSGTVYDNSVASVSFSGSASDPDGEVGSVEYSVNGGTWQMASALDPFQFTAYGLAVGTNMVSIRARDIAGNYSSSTSVCFVSFILYWSSKKKTLK